MNWHGQSPVLRKRQWMRGASHLRGRLDFDDTFLYPLAPGVLLARFGLLPLDQVTSVGLPVPVG